MEHDNKLREKLYQDVLINLGGGIVDIELDKPQIEFAFNYALSIYRQKAANATIERGIIFKYKFMQQEYDLSDSDIVFIREIHRNMLGTSSSTDYKMDPFLMMYVNQMMYALNQNMTYGSIATIALQYNYLSVLEQILASRVNYFWNPSEKKLFIYNNTGRDEVFLIVADCHRSDRELLNDVNVYPWLLSYTSARCKMILGEARSKFQSLAGPTGGVTLNGSELKQEAVAEMEKLEKEITDFVTSDRGYGFIHK